MLAPVVALSDDEQGPLNEPPAKRLKRPGQRRMLQHGSPQIKLKELRHLVQQSCGCRQDCFKPFRGPMFEPLVAARERLCKSDKLDGDTYA